METCSLVFTILSFLVALVSLYLMWNIDKNTTDFNEIRAKKEDKFYKKNIEKLETIAEAVLSDDSRTDAENQKELLKNDSSSSTNIKNVTGNIIVNHNSIQIINQKEKEEPKK